MDITDIHSTLHPIEVEYVFFLKAHRVFFRINHMLGHKTSLKNVKRTEIITISFYYKGMKL